MYGLSLRGGVQDRQFHLKKSTPIVMTIGCRSFWNLTFRRLMTKPVWRNWKPNGEM